MAPAAPPGKRRCSQRSNILPAGMQESCHPPARRQHRGLPGGAAGAIERLELITFSASTARPQMPAYGATSCASSFSLIICGRGNRWMLSCSSVAGFPTMMASGLGVATPHRSLWRSSSTTTTTSASTTISAEPLYAPVCMFACLRMSVSVSVVV